jgi:hypothetical protein
MDAQERSNDGDDTERNHATPLLNDDNVARRIHQPQIGSSKRAPLSSPAATTVDNNAPNNAYKPIETKAADRVTEAVMRHTPSTALPTEHDEYDDDEAVVAERRSECSDVLVRDVLRRAPAHKASSFNDFAFDARDGALPDPLPLDCNVCPLFARHHIVCLLSF